MDTNQFNQQHFRWSIILFIYLSTKIILKDEKVLIRGRVYTVRGKGKTCFMVIRQKTATIQAMLFANDETVSKQMVKYAMNISKESIVDLEGIVKKTEFPIKACTQKDIEIHVTGIWCLSRSEELPFQLSDASRSETEILEAEKAGEQFATVSLFFILN